MPPRRNVVFSNTLLHLFFLEMTKNPIKWRQNFQIHIEKKKRRYRADSLWLHERSIETLLSETNKLENRSRLLLLFSPRPAIFFVWRRSVFFCFFFFLNSHSIFYTCDHRYRHYKLKKKRKEKERTKRKKMNVLLQCDGDKALLLHRVSSSGKKDLLAACRRVTAFEKIAAGRLGCW